MYKKGVLFIFIVSIPLLLLAADTIDNKPDRPWLGVMVADLSEKMLANLKLECGVKITRVYKESPADLAGLQDEDILISFDNHDIKDADNLVDLVRDKKVDDQVEVEYLHEGKQVKVQVKLASRPAGKTIFPGSVVPRIIREFDEDQTWLGVYTVDLNDQLRAYFGVPEEVGILVKEVIKDSPAEKGGLKAGDVIIKVAEKKVKALRDIRRAINYFEAGDEIQIQVIRDKKEKSVKVKLEERKGGDHLYFYGKPSEEFDLQDHPRVKVFVPEIDFESGDFDVEVEPFLEDLPEQLEWKMQELNEKVHEHNDKLEQLQKKLQEAENLYI
jgi:S1-C subfamily serine protease